MKYLKLVHHNYGILYLDCKNLREAGKLIKTYLMYGWIPKILDSIYKKKNRHKWMNQ